MTVRPSDDTTRRADREIRVGIVGTGFLAETRARCWSRIPLARVTGVAGRRPGRAAEFVARRGEAAADVAFAADPYDGLTDLLSRDEIDVVDVCVPNAAHHEVVVAAARAGKHVICTKPFAVYVGQEIGHEAGRAGGSGDRVAETDPATMRRVAEADARAMVSAADEAGVLLCYAENWIYAPSISRAAALLGESDEILVELRGGESHSGSHSDYSKHWRNTGGGALVRLASHPIGAMLHLKRLEGLRRGGRGVRPVAVRADVADLSRVAGTEPEKSSLASGWRDVENWGQVTIEFEDGARGVAWGSDNRLGGMRSELELFASNAYFQCNLSPGDDLRAYAAHDRVYPDAYLIEKQSTTAGWSTPMTDEDLRSGQLDMCRAFAHAIRGGEPPASDGRLGLEVTRVVYAAYQSAREGRRIELDPDDGS